jgi:hypothetical protein
VTGTVARYVVALTGVGLFMLLVTNSEAVTSIVGAFVSVVRQVFALGNVNG